MRFLKVLLVLFFVGIACMVKAQSSADLKRQRDVLTQQLEELNREYQTTANSKKTTLKQLRLLKEQINLREEKINNINSQVRNLDNQISESNNTVHNLQNQLDQLKKEYAAMVLFTYRNQSAYNKLMFIFASNDFNQAYKRLKYLQQIGSYRERQAEYIQETQTELHVKINDLDKSKKEKKNLLADQEKEKATLGKEKNSQAEVVANLSQHEKQIKRQEEDVQRKITKIVREFNAAVRRDIEDARRKAEAKAAAAKANPGSRDAAPTRTRTITKNSTDSEVLNATPEAAKLSNDFLENRGQLPWPVTNGAVKQGFGIYYDSENIKNESFGWDIKTNPGASVRAVFQGTVTNIASISGTYLVVVQHGEYFTAYSNLRSIAVKDGEKVSTKQVVGTVATDSGTGEAVVTFLLYKGKTPVNPKIWLAPN